MHELSVIASLFEILEEKAREHRSPKITCVKLRVGKLSGVVPELLVTAFDMYKPGTIAAEAGVEVAEVLLRVRCRACGADSEVEDYVFRCPSCNATDLEILSGTDLFLDKIELETEDDGPVSPGK